MHNRYKILRQLGKGGMGTLYLASETIANQERWVVVKELIEYYDPQDPQGAAKAQQRFEAEAATLVKLSIQGIPRIFDYFSEGGHYYIVMEFVQGENLEMRLSHLDENERIVPGRAYSIDQALAWGVRLCRMLDRLAAQNVTHLDIKPANLILDKYSEIWLVDFGTAKTHRYPSGSLPARSKKTEVFGTPGYAAPEQVAGQPEARSDVYALAATLYHLLTDDAPQSNPYHFRKLAGLPPDIASALRRGLAEEVSKRPTAAEFADQLERSMRRGSAFRWRDGSQAHDPKDLAVISDKNWQEALDYFKGRAWHKWFEEVHRNDLLAQMERIKARERDESMALDAFLRALDPNLPTAKLHLPKSEIDAGILPWPERLTIDLEVVNQGSGCLSVQVTELSPAIRADALVLAIHDVKQLHLQVNSQLLSPASQPQELSLLLDAGGGGQEKVTIWVQVPEPQVVISPRKIKLQDYDGQAAYTGSFQVENQGDSLCYVNATSGDAWCMLDVGQEPFLLLPGAWREVGVQAYTGRLRGGRYKTTLSVDATANHWVQHAGEIKVEVAVQSSEVRLRTMILPILAIVLFFISSTVAVVIAISLKTIEALSSAILLGMLIGVLTCLGITWVAGKVDELGGGLMMMGKRPGWLRGSVVGLFAGGVAGALFYTLLTGLGLQFEAGEGLGWFGFLVNLVACLAAGGMILAQTRSDLY